MEEDSAIDWSKEHNLQWSDFQAEVNPSSYHSAESVIKYRYNFTIIPHSRGDKTSFSFAGIRLRAQFQKNLSWVRKQDIEDNNASTILLRHEQTRFDLAEALKYQIAATIEKELNGKEFSVRGKSEDEISQNSKNYAESIMFEMVNHLKETVFDEESKQYDEQTEYGANMQKQQEYEKMLNRLRQ